MAPQIYVPTGRIRPRGRRIQAWLVTNSERERREEKGEDPVGLELRRRPGMRALGGSEAGGGVAPPDDTRVAK